MSCKLDWNGISKWIDFTLSWCHGSDICTMSGETLSQFEHLLGFNLHSSVFCIFIAHKPLTTKVYRTAVSWKVVPGSFSGFTATVILSMVGIQCIQRHSAPSMFKITMFQCLIHFRWLYNAIQAVDDCTWNRLNRSNRSNWRVWSFSSKFRGQGHRAGGKFSSSQIAKGGAHAQRMRVSAQNVELYNAGKVYVL